MSLSKSIPLLFLLIGLFSQVKAQQKHSIVGTIVDTTGAALAGATVKLVSPRDTLATAADGEGVFHFEISANTFQLEITLIGFEGLRRKYTIDAAVALSKLDPIKLRTSSQMLSTVVVVGVNPVTIKEDTVEYKASAYKVRPGSPVEELIRKLPGVSVDANGNITAQGQQITKIRVNGKDFFGGDVQTATKNLPADIIDKLQVVDDYGDMANITGIKTGDPTKVLNLEIRKDRNKGYFAQGLLGLGTDGHTARYVGSFSGFYFHDTRQISVIGTLNNTNLSAFRFGSTSSNGQNQNGIATTRSIGVNYRDNWGKKMSVYGSYSFSDQTTLTSSLMQKTSTFQDTSIYTNTSSSETDGNVTHRFTFNMEYKPDTSNYLKITPGFTYTKTSSLSNGLFLNESIVGPDSLKTSNGTNYDHSNSTSPNATLVLLYDHKFKKRGRNFSLNANLGYSNSNAPETVNNLTSVYNGAGDSVINSTRQYQFLRNKNSTSNESALFSWIEPLGKIDFLEFNYTLTHSNTLNDHDTYNIDPATLAQTPVDSLTNDYKYQFTSNKLGINFREIQKKYNYIVGLAAQPSLLSGNSLTTGLLTRRTEFNVFPVARFVYTFSRGHSFTFNYSGKSVQPTFGQLQPVTDRSNPLNPVVGNPDLKQSFMNSISLRYNQYDFKTGNILFANMTVTQTQNQVVNDQVKKGTDTIYNSYRNVNGAMTATGFFNYSKPFDNRHFTASLSGNVSYSNNISFINDQQNTGRNWVVSPAVKFRADLDTIMDSEVSATYTNNSTVYSLPSSRNVNANTWVFALDGRNYFFKNWILGYDLTKTLNKGYGAGINTNPTILNLYVERQFLKNNMASLRIEGYDLFNQNTGVSQTVSGNAVSNSRVSRLARYFMLSYSMRFQNFAGRVPGQGRGRRNGAGGGGGRGDGGGGFGGGGNRGGGGGFGGGGGGGGGNGGGGRINME